MNSILQRKLRITRHLLRAGRVNSALSILDEAIEIANGLEIEAQQATDMCRSAGREIQDLRTRIAELEEGIIKFYERTSREG